MKTKLKYLLFISLVMLYGNELFSQFMVKAGSSITIKEGSNLYIGTNMTLESTSSGSGHFADQTINGDAVITDNIIVERYIQANGWHNVSMPVSTANTSIFSGTDLTFYYDETKVQNDWNFGWVWYQGNLVPFKGYDVFLDASAITTNYTASNSSGLNTGTYNIGVFKTDVANGETENHKGWNLIGNPYPSPVDWLEESGWGKSDINDAKYIWNPAAGSYTIFIGGPNPIGINGGTRFIPSNQGFWVQATTNGSISINNSCRKGIMLSTPDYYKTTDTYCPLISLIAQGNLLSDETIIRFIENTSTGFDVNFDALKLTSGSKMLPQISIYQNKIEFAANSYPKLIDDMEIPINFLCATSGNYCIKLGERSNTTAITGIYLFDKIEKHFVNLSLEGHYCFGHDATNIKQRFIIVINPSSNKLLSLKTASPFLVYSFNKTINISNLLDKETNAEIQVINLLGQTVLSKPLRESNASFTISSGTGYYMVRIVSSEGQFNTKIFIH